MVQLIAKGYSSKQIPSVLKIDLKTVERCRAAVMRKLELSSPAAPARYAIRNRLVEGPLPLHIERATLLSSKIKT